jgi:hypothetical protein
MYLGSIISNYFHGVRAWHILHGLPWKLNPVELDALMMGAKHLAPASSKNVRLIPLILWQPYACSFFLTNCSILWFGLASLSAFYAAAQVGKLTVPQLTSFDTSRHITPWREVNKNQLEATVLHDPQTKAVPMEGKDIF